MNRKVFGLLVILSVISVIPIAEAQIQISQKSNQKSIEIIISSEGKVHVKHIIGSLDEPRNLKLVDGLVSNLSITDKLGQEKQFSLVGSNEVLLVPSRGDSIIEYDLEEALYQKDDVWAWNFKYLETTSFFLPPEADLIFVNERPVYLDEKKGITCHGCQMVLEYSINEPKVLEKIEWEDKEFLVEIDSHSNIDNFLFDQPTESVTFDISENRFVNIVIPLELLSEPYEVFLDDEKTVFHTYKNNGTHNWLNIKPENTGQIIIMGTTTLQTENLGFEFLIIIFPIIGLLALIVLLIRKRINHR